MAKDKKLGSKRGIETMFRTSYRVNMDLSALADNKANIMISINGIIVSIIIASVAPRATTDPWLLIPTSILLVTCVAAIVYAVRAARPRVSSNAISLADVRENRANILFFGNFANMSKDDYVEGMTDLMQSTDLLYLNMVRDLYGLGNVLARKYRLVRISYTIFMWGFTISIIVFIAFFIYFAITE